MSRQHSTDSTRRTAVLAVMTAALLILIPSCLLAGSVDIPFTQVVKALAGQATDNPRWGVIVTEMRLPMALTAAIAGAALALAGLLLQTTFDNPLAGPSILGISTGASLGVAIVMLALGGSVTGVSYYAGILTGAAAGAAVVMLALLGFSMMVSSTAMLLIIGIMTGYLASSAISLLNFFATHEGVHSFVIWGLGSFSTLTLERLAVFAAVSLILMGLTMLMAKPLNALLLGQRYAENLGVDIPATRNRLLLLSGSLTAVVTAFCGPIGFIGLIVPHIARMALRTSNHTVLLPATALCGAVVGTACALISVAFGGGSVIPVNAITPVIGVPIIIYIIINRKKILYFN